MLSSVNTNGDGDEYACVRGGVPWLLPDLLLPIE